VQLALEDKFDKPLSESLDSDMHKTTSPKPIAIGNNVANDNTLDQGKNIDHAA